MDRGSRERRDTASPGERRTFGVLASAALKLRVRESRVPGVRWVVETNLAWVSWPREDERRVFAGLRRHKGLITGELGVSPSDDSLDDLPLIQSLAEARAEGCRVQLGPLLHGHGKTWSAGGSEPALIERLDWLSQQLELKLHSFMAATRAPQE